MRMTKVFTFLLFLLMITHVACDGNNESGQEIKKEEEQEQEQEPEKEPEKGVDVSFAEYTLEGTSCQWVNLDFDDPCPQYNLLMINSSEVLEEYIEGTDYPAIDFSKQTLLLAYGIECYNYYQDSVSLQQLSEQNYLMTVNLRPSIAVAFSEWEVAIVIDKLGAECKVELDITNK
ncbi:hypothetical protein [Parabacteroides sp. PF5-9]|uniref:hypothetical protein n=1 Tax=Parabacteroides sp. PF5-9 TaxID=1742404 RepID=UPI002475B4B8|nr:hypothetical protein [Parabacteroides sp. PF5-9]MDH6356387.1 hypothetical protein [Parabacteroides sp. PF5-9]